MTMAANSFAIVRRGAETVEPWTFDAGLSP
jgi:hypothetical protein